MARALKLTKTATLHFTDDAQIGAWALKGVEDAVAAGYIDGFPNGTFQPLGADNAGTGGQGSGQGVEEHGVLSTPQ